MDFELDESQVLLQRTVRQFMQEKCPPELVREFDEKAEFPLNVWSQLADLGLLGLAVGEEHGGTPGTMIELVIVLEELARSCTSVAAAYANSASFMAKLIGTLGTPQQKGELLSEFVAGKSLFAFAMTEPECGTDALALSTTAELTQNSSAYRLRGTKTFITLAHLAKNVVTVARTSKDPVKKARGVSLFVVPANAPGVSISPIHKVGFRSAVASEVNFDDAMVPKECLLGQLDKGWYQLLPFLNAERISMAAISVGIAEAAFDYAVRYAGERVAFGKTINSFQALQHYFAEMKMMIDAAKLLVYRAAWMESKGKTYDLDATVAYLAAAQAASEVTDKGIQIMGGYGYAVEYDMQRFWRDGRAYRLSPLSTEMAKNIIAEGLGMPRSY